MKRIALYARVSDISEANGVDGSLDNQIHRLRAYVESLPDNKSFKIHEFKEARSGKDIAGRPVFQQILKKVERGDIDTIVVTRLDRAFRNVKETLSFIDDLVNVRGLNFISLNEKFDTSTPIGRAFLTILAAFNQMERESTAERVKNGTISLAKRGISKSGKCTFGYDRDMNIIPEEAEAVLLAFNHYLKVNSYSKTAAFLNTKSIKNKAGKPWHQITISNMLSNRRYIGELEINKKNKKKDQSKLRELDKHSIVKGGWEPIVPSALWDRVQKQLALSSERFTGLVKKERVYLLSEFLYCEDCGTRLVGHVIDPKNSKTYFYYDCQKCNYRVRKDDMDKRIIGILQMLSNQDVYRDVIIKSLNSLTTIISKKIIEKEIELKAVKKEIKAWEEEQDQLLRNRLNNPPKAMLKSIDEKYEKLAENLEWRRLYLDDLEGEVKDLQHTMIDEVNLNKVSIDNFLSDEMDEAQKKLILKQIISKIIIDSNFKENKKIEILFKTVDNNKKKGTKEEGLTFKNYAKAKDNFRNNY